MYWRRLSVLLRLCSCYVSFQFCTKGCWQAEAAALQLALVPEWHDLPDRSRQSQLCVCLGSGWDGADFPRSNPGTAVLCTGS